MHLKSSVPLFLLLVGLLASPAWAQQAPRGEIKGSATQHTPESLSLAISGAALVLPAAATGGATYTGKFADAPPASSRVPVVVFLHGSSGLGLKAIGEWQQRLATLGIASIAPDSFTLPERLTYSSPIEKDVYERIHALRASEIDAAFDAVSKTSWANMNRVILAGTSEGAVAVARHGGKGFAARIIYAWSCEQNYFVIEPKTALAPDLPVLNVISSVDPFFSQANAWLGNAAAKGNCAEALKDHKHAVILLVPGAPHTLINLPLVRSVTAAFIAELGKP